MEISAIIMGQRVRAARKAKEMRTEELAEKVNVAVESIGHIECGARKPSLTLLFNIAEVLGVSLDYLTGRTESTGDTLLHECAEHNDLTLEQEHMVSVACAWQQRVYSAAMDGFYCGYRAAYKIMDAINPLVKVRCVDKILTMEYHLGYIQPDSEVERLRDMAA